MILLHDFATYKSIDIVQIRQMLEEKQNYVNIQQCILRAWPIMAAQC